MSIPGFRFGAVEAGIKKRGGLDLGLILAEQPVVAAGVFTQNLVLAHPVVVAHERVQGGKARAVLVNSGNANCCAGPAGDAAVAATTEALAKAVGVGPELVLPASTGVIGQALPASRVVEALPALLESLSDDYDRFAESILTTDRFAKTAQVELETEGAAATLAVIAKGAGMIHPDLATGLPQATMLAFICTDAVVARADLEAALLQASQLTFNACTVDGDTSTNDTVLALASGKAGRATREQLTRAMETVCGDVARKMVLDGEGAEHAVDLIVSGLDTAGDARQAAFTMATSLLVKTALSGCDPNWGRLLAAAGRSGVRFDPKAARIWVEDVLIVQNASPEGPEAEARATEIMQRDRYTIRVELGPGPASFRYITSDLGHGYVDVNAGYRS